MKASDIEDYVNGLDSYQELAKVFFYKIINANPEYQEQMSNVAIQTLTRLSNWEKPLLSLTEYLAETPLNFVLDAARRRKRDQLKNPLNYLKFLFSSWFVFYHTSELYMGHGILGRDMRSLSGSYWDFFNAHLLAGLWFYLDEHEQLEYALECTGYPYMWRVYANELNEYDEGLE